MVDGGVCAKFSKTDSGQILLPEHREPEAEKAAVLPGESKK